MTRALLIVGAGSQGRVVLDAFRSVGTDVSGFLDAQTSLHGTRVFGMPVLGGMDWLDGRSDTAVFVAVGSSPVRMKLIRRLQELRFGIPSAIHRSAIVAPDVLIGEGNLLCSGSIVGTGSRLGDGVVLNTGSTLDHDSELRDGAYVSPGVHTAGRVVVGKGAFIGVGASVGPAVAIGDRAVVGAGSVVLDSVPAGMLVYGSPARPIRKVNASFNWRVALSGVDDEPRP